MEHEKNGINGGASSENLDELYKAVIGPKNQDYDVRNFQRFDRQGNAGVVAFAGSIRNVLLASR